MKKAGDIANESDDSVSYDNRNSDGENNNHSMELPDEDLLKSNSSRRDFLKIFGFGFASAALVAGCKIPVKKAVPYIVQPPELTPGKSVYFASAFYGISEMVYFFHTKTS